MRFLYPTDRWIYLGYLTLVSSILLDGTPELWHVAFQTTFAALIQLPIRRALWLAPKQRICRYTIAQLRGRKSQSLYGGGMAIRIGEAWLRVCRRLEEPAPSTCAEPRIEKEACRSVAESAGKWLVCALPAEMRR